MDWRPSFGEGFVPSRSPLTLPLGTGTVLGHVASRLAEVGHAAPMVLSADGEDPEYEAALRSCDVSGLGVLCKAEFHRFLGRCEAADYLLIVEPRNWPAAGYDLDTVLRYAGRYRGATHAIAIQGNGDRAWERVECDDRGHVRRVQRLYAPMHWPEAKTAPIACSIVPARALCGVAFSSLAELRCGLIEKGLFAQDVPLMSDVYDLSGPAGFLQLTERVLDEATRRRSSNGYVVRGPNVLVSSHCRIDGTARLVGPVVVQTGAVVDAGAMIVGPAVVGADARIGDRAVVAHSLLGRGAVVDSGKAVCREVVWGGVPACPSDGKARSDWRDVDLPRFAHGVGTAALSDGSGDCVVGRRRIQLAAKRVLDVVGSLLGLILFSPVLAGTAALIWLRSGRPIFFVHRREGKGGREFPCLKFRTMKVGAHREQRGLYGRNEVDGPQFKLENDPRVTRLGRVLRVTNIDELPQLFNVLVGQMSLVGPRPSPFRENQVCVPWRMARLSVRPGITGLWQLCRDRRSEGDFHQWIFYDILYVRRYSLWLDLKILVYTVLSLGGRRTVPLSRFIRQGEVECGD